MDDVVLGHLAFGRLIAHRVMLSMAVPPAWWPDVEASAMLGLCEAARTWEPERGAFTTWAGYAVRYHAQREVRMLRRLPVADVDGLCLPDDPWPDVEDRDEMACHLGTVMDAIARIPERERVLLTRWCSGARLRSMAAEEGVSHQRLSQVLDKAKRRVRAEVGA